MLKFVYDFGRLNGFDRFSKGFGLFLDTVQIKK